MLRVMFRRSSRNILLLVGLLAISSGLSTYVAANQNAAVKVSATLDEHWRGAYDILVRPNDAVQPMERQYGVVESNYLSAESSGITVQQWKEIEKLQGVEVAAPVSTIGYFRNSIGSVTLEVPPQTEPSLYRFSMVITSTNGYRDVGLNTYLKYLPLGPPPPGNDGTGTQAETDEFVRSVYLTEATGNVSFGPDGSVSAQVVARPPVVWTLMAGIDPAAERRLTHLDAAIVEHRYLSDNDGITTVKVGGNSVPESERSDADFSLDYRQDRGNRRVNPNGPDVPVIYASSTYAGLLTTARVDKFKMPEGETLTQLREFIHQEYVRASVPGAGGDPGRDPQGEAQTKFLEGLQHSGSQTLFDISLNLSDILKPMSERPIVLSIYPGQEPLQKNPGQWISEAGGIGKSYQPGAITYEPHSVKFDTSGMITLAAVPKVDAQTIISLTGETAFRSLAPSTPAMLKPGWDAGIKSYNKSPFTFHETGSYDLSKLPTSITQPDPLTYVPLGIYQPPLASLVRDAEGKLLPGGPVTLRPTINPASFIPGPPLAFTNIASARFFRGEACIDAIRVRVAGIDRYTPENVAKVEAVAAQIIKSTGLHVDIVAGSSPQKVLVYIPGSPDGTVAPLGYAEEPWTTLGTAATISTGIDRASVLMLAATGMTGLLYLISQSLLSTLSRRKELALLQAVGWRRRHVAGLVLGEAAILGLLGGLCAVALAMLIAWGLGLLAPLEQSLAAGAVVLLLYLLASTGPAWWIVRQPVAELLQRGEVALPAGRIPRERGEGKSRTRFFSGMGGGLWGLALFAWRNLARRRVRTILAAGGVAIATALLTVLVTTLTALSGVLRVTLLGQFVGLQVETYHYVMVGSAIVVSILAVADHLAMGVLERRPEIALLQSVGWRAGAVRLSLLFEGVWLGLIGGGAGTLITILFGLTSPGQGLWQAWWVAPAALMIMLGLCGICALYAIMLIPRHALVKVLQQ
jgi:putative ABC transport system permease protein